MGGEAHDVFLDAEDLEILQIHLVHGVELALELLLGAVDVGVVHLERAHAHEAEEFAALLVAIAGAVFGEAQRQVAITARHRREELVVMRAVHRLEVVAFPKVCFHVSLEAPQSLQKFCYLGLHFLSLCHYTSDIWIFFGLLNESCNGLTEVGKSLYCFWILYEPWTLTVPNAELIDVKAWPIC